MFIEQLVALRELASALAAVGTRGHALRTAIPIKAWYVFGMHGDRAWEELARAGRRIDELMVVGVDELQLAETLHGLATDVGPRVTEALEAILASVAHPSPLGPRLARATDAPSAAQVGVPLFLRAQDAVTRVAQLLSGRTAEKGPFERATAEVRRAVEAHERGARDELWALADWTSAELHCTLVHLELARGIMARPREKMVAAD